MDVGKTLQDARVANGVSLDTVARETNIRKIYLEAGFRTVKVVKAGRAVVDRM